MTEKEFKNNCLDIFENSKLSPDNSHETRTKRVIKLLQSIHPNILYPNPQSVSFSLMTEALIFRLSSGNCISIPDWAGNPAGLACIFSGYPVDKKMAGFVKQIYEICENKEVPTPRTAETFLKLAEKKNLDFCWSQKQEDLYKINFYKSEYNKNHVRWIPNKISINELAAVVISTGDLPDKKYAQTLSENLKKNELLGKNYLAERT